MKITDYALAIDTHEWKSITASLQGVEYDDGYFLLVESYDQAVQRLIGEDWQPYGLPDLKRRVQAMVRYETPKPRGDMGSL